MKAFAAGIVLIIAVSLLVGSLAGMSCSQRLLQQVTAHQAETPIPADFQSLAEFQEFVDTIGIIIVFDETGLLYCYDAALFYWTRAYEQGKRVYLQSVYPVEYNSYFTKRQLERGEGHIVISAYIGKQIYWVDPSTVEIILRGEVR